MKRYIYIHFAFAMVTIGVIAALMFATHGIKGLILYLTFAALCLTPVVVKARKILKS